MLAVSVIYFGITIYYGRVEYGLIGLREGVFISHFTKVYAK
jgi:hypothetical protein